MVERITVSAPEGTREELLALAHKEGMNLSKYLTNPASQMTYICEHPSGKLKVGVSNNPRVRATKFGRIVAIIFDETAEQAILKHFPSVTAPDGVKEGKTEWVGVNLDEVLDFASISGFELFAVKNGYENKGKGRPRSGEPTRTAVVHVNLTVEEKCKVSADAEAAGLTVSDYIRSKII